MFIKMVNPKNKQIVAANYKAKMFLDNCLNAKEINEDFDLFDQAHDIACELELDTVKIYKADCTIWRLVDVFDIDLPLNWSSEERLETYHGWLQGN